MCSQSQPSPDTVIPETSHISTELIVPEANPSIPHSYKIETTVGLKEELEFADELNSSLLSSLGHDKIISCDEVAEIIQSPNFETVVDFKPTMFFDPANTTVSDETIVPDVTETTANDQGNDTNLSGETVLSEMVFVGGDLVSNTALADTDISEIQEQFVIPDKLIPNEFTTATVLPDVSTELPEENKVFQNEYLNIYHDPATKDVVIIFSYHPEPGVVHLPVFQSNDDDLPHVISLVEDLSHNLVRRNYNKNLPVVSTTRAAVAKIRLSPHLISYLKSLFTAQSIKKLAFKPKPKPPPKSKVVKEKKIKIKKIKC